MLGDDLTSQIQSLQKASSQRGNARIAVGVVSLRPSEGLSWADSPEGNLIISSKRRGFPEGLFAFASVDAATHAALCTWSLPSLATNDKVNDEGLAIITRAFRDVYDQQRGMDGG